MKNQSQQAYELGQSVWYDNIQRSLLENGELAGMIANGEIYGVTSNPSIFNNAIGKSSDYDDALIPLAKDGKTAVEIYEALAVSDIQAVTDLFADLYQRTDGGDGYVSLEVNPALADDTEGTARDAKRIWEMVDRPNLMVKIPATKAGLPAIRQVIAAGVNVNVTLIFSVDRYLEVMDAYLAGLEDRLAAGHSIDTIASVASFFVSRIDSLIDNKLENIVEQGGEYSSQANNLQGKVAIANAKLAYMKFEEVFSSERFKRLKSEGAKLQRPLWASTSTKNAAYSDVLYVDSLIGADTVNTIPPKTLNAFNDHGEAGLSLEENMDQALADLATLEKIGISLKDATEFLEEDGVKKFAAAFQEMIDTVESRRKEA